MIALAANIRKSRSFTSTRVASLPSANHDPEIGGKHGGLLAEPRNLFIFVLLPLRHNESTAFAGALQL